MKTTLTDGQLMSTLKLLKQKGVTPERFQVLLSTGILADLLEADLESYHLDDRVISNLRNRLRIPLGLHAKDLISRVDNQIPFEDLVRSNHYHKVRNPLSKGDMSEIASVTSDFAVELISFDTINVEDWNGTREMEADLESRKLRVATPQELICFDGEHPFVANYLALCIYTRLTILGEENPIEIVVATNQKPGPERNLSFYPSFFPISSSGKRMLVVPT